MEWNVMECNGMKPKGKEMEWNETERKWNETDVYYLNVIFYILYHDANR